MTFWKGLYGLIIRLFLCIVLYIILINSSFSYNPEKGLLWKNILWGAKQIAKVVK